MHENMALKSIFFSLTMIVQMLLQLTLTLTLIYSQTLCPPLICLSSQSSCSWSGFPRHTLTIRLNWDSLLVLFGKWPESGHLHCVVAVNDEAAVTKDETRQRYTLCFPLWRRKSDRVSVSVSERNRFCAEQQLIAAPAASFHPSSALVASFTSLNDFVFDDQT